MKHLFLILLAFFAALSASAYAAAPEHFIKPGKPAPDFRLNDQFIRVQQLKDFRGMPVVILYTGRDRFDDTAQIIWQLEKKYNRKKSKEDVEKIHIMGVAYLSGVPSFVKKKVKKHMKKPQYPSFLMDWNSEIESKYGYDQSKISAFIIDSEGIVRHAGVMLNTDEDKAALIQKIDTLLIVKN
jgi:peroxiredoxin